MLRSLWSGVSGMQAHQIALDVESNNIANVNTNGFKYSRADFSTMITQTKRSATIPYGGYGGVNDFSVGLGTGIETTTKVFSQGSLQNTDRKADLALSGQGMFTVSNNGGFTRMYTRDGAFSFDAVGNLVTTSGYIVQGWVRDLSKLGCDCGTDDINRVDNTGPIGGITVDPRLTIPARATEEITGRVNLTSGNKTSHTTCPAPLDSTADNNFLAVGNGRIYDTNDKQHEVAEDMGVMFSEGGDAMKIQDEQGIWVSYAQAVSKTLNFARQNVNATDTNVDQERTTTIEINGERITWTNNPLNSKKSHVQATAEAINAQKEKTGVKAEIRGAQIVLVNDNSLDGDGSNKNIDVDLSVNGNGNQVNGVFSDQVNGGVANAGANTGGFTNPAGAAQPNLDTEKVTTAFNYTYSSATGNTDNNGTVFKTTEDLRHLMQRDANRVKNFGGDSALYRRASEINGVGGVPVYDSTDWTVKVIMNNTGSFEILNKDDGPGLIGTIPADPAVGGQQPIVGYTAALQNLNIMITAFHDDDTSANVLFKDAMRAMNTGTLAEGGSATSTSGFRMATYGQTVELFDSLGNKHEMEFEFTKIGGNEWRWRALLPEPAEFLGSPANRPNIFEGGNITFGENGAVTGFNPATLQFRPNNGAEGPQDIDLKFGTAGGFTGFTSTAEDSNAKNFGGDGYGAGSLQDFYFDKTGTMVGKFSNGQTLALAQVAIATFANYEGLQEAGSNLYGESPNSGDPTFGGAGEGGRADIAASKLEMSNADLSRGLTQLIVVQRGFQASSKSVTTSDQVLNTLLGLKQ